MRGLGREKFSSIPWQASGTGVFMNLRDEIMLIKNTSGTYHQPTVKKLTIEATFMIFVLLFFAILFLIGSAIDVYEYFRKRSTKKERSGDLQKEISTNEVSSSEDEKKSSENSVWMKNCKLFLSCFSVRKNAKSLLDTSSDEQRLNCLDGFRSLAFIIIIIGHIFGVYASVVKNQDEIISNSLIRMAVPEGVLAVDAFLLFSGVLNGYAVSRQYHKNNGKISWLSIPFRRFMRLTPVQLIVLGIYTTLPPYLGSGPLWPKFDINPICRETWIWNLLYLNNFLPLERMCIEANWYLACLMQLHTISPLLLYPILRKPKIGYPLTFFAILMSCLATFVVMLQYDLINILKEIIKDSPDVYGIIPEVILYFEKLHSKPYVRFSGYGVGIALGCYIHTLELRKIKINIQKTLSFGWIFSIITMVLPMFIIFPQRSIYKAAVFHSVKASLYTCGLSWIILMCLTEHAGSLNKFLSCKFFRIFSRLIMSSYLTHMLVLGIYCLSLEELIDHSYLTMVLIVVYLFLWINVVSFIFSLIIAMPISNIYDLFNEMFKKKVHKKMN